MTRTTARRLLWLAALLLVPVPYLVAVEGVVPVVRFAMLGAIAGAYAMFVNGTGVAWPLTALLFGQAALWAAALWALAALLARLLPGPTRGPLTVALVVAGFAGALVFEIYHTPFAAEAARTSWAGLFR